MQGRSAIRLYDTATLTERGDLPGQGRIFSTIALSHDGRFIAAGTLDGTLFVWDRQSKDELVATRIDSRAWRFLVFSADGHSLTAATSTGVVQQWALNVQ